jgi:aerobic-type carbon monoxide dehydrogenase small subunit (CoxS/CutS family)
MPKLTLIVNGRSREVDADAGSPLSYVLREKLGLTGTKAGCQEGICGSCTVLLRGKPVRSCITAVSAARDSEILTIEGLAPEGRVHRVQEAFLQASAFQCGYCTPGMIMRSVALLAATRRPTDEQIKQALQGNFCRCGSYPRIMQAVRLAAGGESRG